MKIKKFVFSVFAVNTFVVWDENSKEALIIDPGAYSPLEEIELKEFIKGEGLNLKYLINTHCHIDHIFGNAFVKENYDVKFLAPEGDVFLLDLMVEHAKDFGLSMKPSPKPDELLSEKTKIALGTIEAKLIATPGHTPDGYCIYFEKEKSCFTGDVLFCESIGRTDLWGGDFSLIMASIKQKLLTLPEDVKIFAGHGEESSIGYEKNNNPFLN